MPITSLTLLHYLGKNQLLLLIISDVVLSGTWMALKWAGLWCWDKDTDLKMDPYFRRLKWPPLALQSCFTFQQDGVPAHTARITQDWLQANCPWVHWEESLATHSPDLNWTITSGAPCWKSIINSIAETQENWWVESRFADPLGRAATRTHQQGGGKLHQALDWLRGCQWWSLRSSAVRIRFRIRILISAP